MKKVLRIIEDVILIFVIILLIGYVVLRFSNKLEIYKVETGSMEDGIHVGDYLLIMKQEEYKVGDIITFEKNGTHITHRIIRKNGEKIVTKGDANNIEDESIREKDIVGKLIFKSELLNIIINYKFVIVGILIGLYLISYCLDNVKKEDKEESENKKVKE